jgi:adenosylcobinamide-phosphate synthase
METCLILIFAFFLDLVFGEPPAILHPVVYMGKLIRFLEYYFFKGNTLTQFLLGACLSLLVIAAFTIPTYFLLTFLKEKSYSIYLFISIVLLKTTFALKTLKDSAKVVKDSLSKKDLLLAKEQLKSLVSRENKDLDERLIISATIESVGENTTDSVISPWLFFVFLGVPGAMAFRAINTLDAMIGYRGKYEYFGKFAARLDDIANLIPARIAGLLICIASLFVKKDFLSSFSTMLSGRRKTESPNAGFTIGAIAGALGVELEKKGHYKIGKTKKPLDITAIEDGIKVLEVTAIAALFLCIGLVFLRDQILNG